MDIMVGIFVFVVFGLVHAVPPPACSSKPEQFGINYGLKYSYTYTTDVLAWGLTVTSTVPICDFNTTDATVIVNGATNGTLYVYSMVNKPDDGVRKQGEMIHINTTGWLQKDAQNNNNNYYTLHDYTTSPQTQPVIPNGPTGMAPTFFNYVEVLTKSLLFYEAQRSGKLPANNRIPWRADSALGDKGQHNEDLTGGYYDAGDLVKFNYPMAHTTSLLAWGYLQWPEAYTQTGQDGYLRDALKWSLDYLLKCHISKHELYVQVGDPDIDHPIWGRPENMTMARPAIKIDEQHPGSDVAGETAAAMAAGYLVFKTIDPSYADKLLNHSIQLYNFGVAFPGRYTESLHLNIYGSSNANDEMYWASSWLYKVTGDDKYKTQAMNYRASSNTNGGASWEDKTSYASALLYNLTGDATIKKELETYLKNNLPGGNTPYTFGGLVFASKWGSLRNAANIALVAMMAAESGINTTMTRCWAQSQIDYALGDNPSNRSYVAGFGNNPPTHYHHRPSSCPAMIAPCTFESFDWPGDNPHILYGGLVGGPGLDDSYADLRSDYVKNEVAMDYNAAFQSSVAGLINIALNSGRTTTPQRHECIV